VSSHSKESRDDIGGNKAGVNVRRRLFLTSLGVAAISVGVGYVLGSVSKPLEVGREILTTTVTKTATQTIEHTRPAEVVTETITTAIPTTVTQTIERSATVTSTSTVMSTATVTTTATAPRLRGSVAIVKSSSSADGTASALNLIRNDIAEIVKGRRKFLIKPNFVTAYNSLATTPLKTVEPVLDFIYSRFNVSEVVIAETPAVGTLDEALRNYGYTALRQKYSGVEFLDLDEYDQEMLILKDVYGNEFEVYVSKILLDRSFVKISPCRAKTHDTVVVTLSIKNMVMGGIKNAYRRRMHSDYLAINYNIAKLAVHLMPDIGVVDGVVAMEGNGPISGYPKNWGVVFASTNPVNLDSVVAYAMGFNPGDVGYLYFLSKWGYGEIDMSRVDIVGESIESVKTTFKPHYSYGQQLSWKQSLDKAGSLD